MQSMTMPCELSLVSAATLMLLLLLLLPNDE
jgi:hypothetical protein